MPIISKAQFTLYLPIKTPKIKQALKTPQLGRIEKLWHDLRHEPIRVMHHKRSAMWPPRNYLR